MSKTPALDNQEESKPFSPLLKKHMSTKEHLIKPEVHLGVKVLKRSLVPNPSSLTMNKSY